MCISVSVFVQDDSDELAPLSSVCVRERERVFLCVSVCVTVYVQDDNDELALLCSVYVYVGWQ